jgi:hypothetical protein
MKKDDYLITNSKVAEDGNVEPTWLGVRNKVDETSIDKWENQIGWYVATIILISIGKCNVAGVWS